jgi:endogenous inhibitor of DNA gyrase (YacG/DUF329 family)
MANLWSSSHNPCRNRSPTTLQVERPVQRVADGFDALDQHLLQLLQHDARQSYRALAKQANSTTPTVAARIRRMEEAGLILGYTVRLDPAAFAQQLAEVQVGRPQVQCHTCHSWTAKPLWATLDGKRHPFCCPTCKKTFIQRFGAMRKGL